MIWYILATIGYLLIGFVLAVVFSYCGFDLVFSPSASMFLWPLVLLVLLFSRIDDFVESIGERKRWEDREKFEKEHPTYFRD